MVYMAIHTRHALLAVGSVWEVHTMFLVAINAQGGNVVFAYFIARSSDFLQRCAVRIMTGSAVHAALVVGAYFPILPPKTRIAVAASAQIWRSIDGHGGLGVIGGRRSVACFASHAICLEGSRGRIVAGSVAHKTRTWLALGCPRIQKNRVAPSFAMSAIFPGHLKLGVADCTILGAVGGLWGGGCTASLCAGNNERYARGKQGEHNGNQKAFDTRGHLYNLLGSIVSVGTGASMKTSQ
jgi:hypothetical protein